MKIERNYKGRKIPLNKNEIIDSFEKNNPMKIYYVDFW